MGDDRYYRDAPSFRRRDPLKTWSFIFMVTSAGALVWVLVLFWLMATRRLDAPTDTALGLTQTTWVMLATSVLFLSLVGLVFVVVARVNRSRAEGYLDATAARQDEEGPPRAQVTRAPERAAAAVDEPGALQAGAGSGGSAVQVAAVREAARVEAASGPDGRMLLSYTVPVEQPRGLYADTYVPVDSDVVLNVKTLLAKTPGAR